MLETTITSILVVLSVALADFAWARYTYYIAHGGRFLASTWAIAIIVLGAFSVISYTQNHWMIIPAGIGAFIGTWFGSKKH